MSTGTDPESFVQVGDEGDLKNLEPPVTLPDQEAGLCALCLTKTAVFRCKKCGRSFCNNTMRKSPSGRRALYATSKVPHRALARAGLPLQCSTPGYLKEDVMRLVFKPTHKISCVFHDKTCSSKPLVKCSADLQCPAPMLGVQLRPMPCTGRPLDGQDFTNVIKYFALIHMVNAGHATVEAAEAAMQRHRELQYYAGDRVVATSFEDIPSLAGWWRRQLDAEASYSTRLST